MFRISEMNRVLGASLALNPPRRMFLAQKGACLACLQASRAASTVAGATGRRNPTIFAVASGQGRSAISILRISGPDVLHVWKEMTLPPRGSSTRAASGKPVPRRASLRRIVHPQTKELLDEGLALYFPRSSALTGQDTLELHCHGSPPLMTKLLRILPSLSPNIRLAEPGEFTRLAFEAGKMSLIEVEGLQDLINADTEAQRQLATRQAGGRIGKAYERMRKDVIDALALTEALIDFGEDEGISEDVFDGGQLCLRHFRAFSDEDLARSKATSLIAQIESILSDEHRGEVIRSGIKLAIIGPPNAGKSSLLNWLAKRDAAIVTSVPGTTRDVIELSLDWEGYPLKVVDTAGLRATKDEVEKIGIERARTQALEANLKIVLLSLEEVFASGKPDIDSETLALIDDNSIIALNKSDVFTPSSKQLDDLVIELEKQGCAWVGKSKGKPFQEISIATGDGMATLSDSIRDSIRSRFDVSNIDEDVPIVTQARHRRHLEECRDHLQAFLEFGTDDIVVAAEELRYASLAIGRLTGVVDVEEVLGEIFRGFCIGK